MLLSTGILQVFAAEQTKAVIFADDFESYTEGADIPFKANALKSWSTGARSATSTVKAYKDETGMVLRISNTAEKSGGPRAEKHLYLNTVKNLTLSFRVKTVNATAVVTAQMSDGKTDLVRLDTQGKWVSYEFEFDFNKNTFDMSENGKLKQRNAELVGKDRAEVKFVFEAPVSAGKEGFYDDILFTTTDSVDAGGAGDKHQNHDSDKACRRRGCCALCMESH